MSTDRPPLSPRTTFLCGLLAVGMGLFLLLTGLGVVTMKPRAGDGPLWIAAVAGIAFMFAGASIAFGALQGVDSTGEIPREASFWSRLLYYGLGLVCCGCLPVIGSWIAFGPGLRHFGGTGLFLLSPDANTMVGRTVFGIGAIITWLLVIALAVRAARKLFPR
jgi:hypothetical protein